jgi:hypothetical protein
VGVLRAHDCGRDQDAELPGGVRGDDERCHLAHRARVLLRARFRAHGLG